MLIQKATTALNVGKHAVFLTDRAHTVATLLIEQKLPNTMPSAVLHSGSQIETDPKILQKVATALELNAQNHNICIQNYYITRTSSR